MSPEPEISQLISRALIDPKFQNKLLDPESRREALESAMTGNNKVEGIPLTEKEITSLEKIDSTDLPGFSLACSNYDRLMGRE